MTKLYPVICTAALLCLNTAFGQTSFVPAAPTSQFAASLDVHGNQAVVSSRSYPFPPGPFQGKLHFFTIDGSQVVQTAALVPADVTDNDSFGRTVSIWGDFAAAGAHLHDATGVDAGAVYIYRNTGGEWNFFQKITAFDAQPGDQFGDVKLVDGTLFVSAPNSEPAGNDPNQNTGAIYIYNFDGNEFAFAQKLQDQDLIISGSKMEVEGDKLVTSGSNGQQETGLLTFQFADSNWQFSNLISNVTGTVIFDFSLDANQLYVLNMQMLGNSDHLRIFTANEDYWIEQPSLSFAVPPGVPEDQIYKTIEVNSGRMLLGSEGGMLLYPRKWPVLSYRLIEGQWEHHLTYYGEGPVGIDDGFGESIASSGNLVVVGARIEQKAYVLELEPLSTPSFNASEFSISPNPATDMVFLDTTNDAAIAGLTVYDLGGRPILESKSSEFSVAGLSGGLYLVRVSFTDGRQATAKLLKK